MGHLNFNSLITSLLASNFPFQRIIHVTADGRSDHVTSWLETCPWLAASFLSHPLLQQASPGCSAYSSDTHPASFRVPAWPHSSPQPYCCLSKCRFYSFTLLMSISHPSPPTSRKECQCHKGRHLCDGSVHYCQLSPGTQQALGRILAECVHA